MDSLIAAAARALVAGDALGALKRVALRDDPPALALRGIAMAQLGEHPRARELLRRAARGFGAHEELARARCVVAEAEVALAMRDLRGSPRTLAAALATLEARADRANALQARLIAVRRLLLLGRLDEAASALARLDARGLPPSLLAVAQLAAAEVALRSLRTAPARAALARAHEAAERARVPALLAEVAEARAALDQPAAPTSRTGRACASRSAVCARSPRRWRASRPARAASRSRRATSAPSSSWWRPSTAIRRRSWRCSPTARPGPPRPWRWPSGPASARSSARSSSWRPPDGCARSGARVRSAGCRRRWPDSRRSCYSPPRCRSGRLVLRRRSEVRRKEPGDDPHSRQDKQDETASTGARGRDRA